MDKLYSPFNTSRGFDWKGNRKYCSQKSRIEEVEEPFLKKAIIYAEQNNIIGEPSGLSSLALFFQLDETRKLDPEKKIFIVNTGKLKIYTKSKEKKEKTELKHKYDK